MIIILPRFKRFLSNRKALIIIASSIIGNRSFQLIRLQPILIDFEISRMVVSADYIFSLIGRMLIPFLSKADQKTLLFRLFVQ